MQHEMQEHISNYSSEWINTNDRACQGAFILSLCVVCCLFYGNRTRMSLKWCADVELIAGGFEAHFCGVNEVIVSCIPLFWKRRTPHFKRASYPFVQKSCVPMLEVCNLRQGGGCCSEYLCTPSVINLRTPGNPLMLVIFPTTKSSIKC